MRITTLALVAASGIGLAACDPTTGLPSADACAKAQLILALAELNSDLVGEERQHLIARLRTNIVALCPPSVAAELEAEVETEVGADVALPLDVVAPE